MNEPRRAHQMLINGLTMWGALAVGVAVGLILTPLIIDRLGYDQLGVWRLLISIVGYSGLVQMALGAGVIRYLSKCRGDGDQEGFNRFFSVALVLTGLFSVVVVGFVFAFSQPIAAFFDVQPEDLAEFDRTIRVLAFAAAFIGLNSILSFIPYSHERIDLQNGVNAVAEVVRGVASVLVIYNDGTLAHLAMVHCGTTVLGMGAYLYIRYRWFPAVRFSLASVDLPSVKALVSFGFFAFLVKIGDFLRFQLDLVVIGRFVHLKAAGIYSVSLMLFRYIIMSVVAISDVTQPRLAALYSKPDELSASVLRFSRIVSCVAVGFCGCGAVAAPDFLRVWLPDEPESAALSAQAFLILLIALIPDLMTAITVVGLRAINRHSLYAAQNIVEGLANLGLSIFLALRMGLIGVAYGTAIPCFLAKVFVQPVYCCRLLRVPLGTFYLRVMVLPLLPGVAWAGIVMFALGDFVPETYVGVGVKALSFLVGYCATAFYFTLDAPDRAAVVAMVRSKLKRS